MEKIDKQSILIAIGAGILGILIGISGSSFRGDYPKGERNMHDMMAEKNMQGDMKSEMHEMMMGIDGKSGDEFDKAFLDEMIIHHEGAVKMAESALKNAEHQEIKDLSTAIISAQNTEIAQMKKWKSEWYSN